MKRHSARVRWPMMPLEALRASGDYTLIGGPFGSDLTAADYVDGPGVPVIRGTNLGGKESRFVDADFVYVSEYKAERLRRNLAFPGDVVFTQRGTLGQVAVIPKAARFERYVISQSQMKLTPNPSRIDSRFLYHYFRAPETVRRLLSETQATGVPHINLGILKKFHVVVPSLPEQQRIAEVLDRAEALRAKRRIALARLDSLTQSLFIDLFGDPVTNPKRWPVHSLKQCTKKIQIGPFGSLLHQDDYVSGGIPLINPRHIQGGALATCEAESVTRQKFEELESYKLSRDDIVMGRRGEMGRCAIVTEDKPLLCGTGSLIIRPDDVRTCSIFVWAILSTPQTKAAFERLSLGQTLPNLNSTIVENFTIPLPPLPLQQEFARRVAAVEKLKSAHRASLAELDALFASLQHRAFRGEL